MTLARTRVRRRFPQGVDRRRWHWGCLLFFVLAACGQHASSSAKLEDPSVAVARQFLMENYAGRDDTKSTKLLQKPLCYLGWMGDMEARDRLLAYAISQGPRALDSNAALVAMGDHRGLDHFAAIVMDQTLDRSARLQALLMLTPITAATAASYPFPEGVERFCIETCTAMLPFGVAIGRTSEEPSLPRNATLSQDVKLPLGILRERGTKRSIPFFEALVRDGDDKCAALCAISGLRRIGDSRAAQVLDEVAQDSRWPAAQRAAAIAFMVLVPDAPRQARTKKLLDSAADKRERIQFASGLARLEASEQKRDEYIGIVREGFGASDKEIRGKTYALLAALGDDSFLPAALADFEAKPFQSASNGYVGFRSILGVDTPSIGDEARTLIKRYFLEIFLHGKSIRASADASAPVLSWNNDAELRAAVGPRIEQLMSHSSSLNQIDFSQEEAGALLGVHCAKLTLLLRVGDTASRAEAFRRMQELFWAVPADRRVHVIPCFADRKHHEKAQPFLASIVKSGDTEALRYEAARSILINAAGGRRF